MRKTHPVNALKKLGIGLAFGAATIMSMPTSALACTQIYMGGKLTADGNTYYGRAEDFGKRYLKHYGIEPAHEPGFKYSSIESALNTLRTSLPIATAMYATTPPTGWVAPTPTPRPASTRRASPAPPR
jgi:dipeptidase